MLSRLFDEKKYKPLEYILRGYRENRVVNTEEKKELIKLKEYIEASGMFNKEINLILFHIDKIVYPEYIDLSDLVPGQPPHLYGETSRSLVDQPQ